MAQSKIWILAEQREQQLSGVGLELLGKARELAGERGWKVALVLIGDGLDPIKERVSSFGADEILVADHPLLRSYCCQAYAKVLEGAVRKHRPEIFLFGATAMGTDLAARLAARLRSGVAAHCIDLKLSPEGNLLAVVPGWGGNVLATIHCPAALPQMATVMPGCFPMPEERESIAKVIPLEVNVGPADVTCRVLEITKEEAGESPLEKAEIVVAGGSGVRGEQEWQRLKEFASVLNGAVGATRPPVDEGWASEDQMIGQSGRSIHPKLYVGVGISGQMHHMVGIKDAGLIVAVNQDPDAPIFQQCDLGVVGDHREILPCLIQEIRKRGA